MNPSEPLLSKQQLRQKLLKNMHTKQKQQQQQDLISEYQQYEEQKTSQFITPAPDDNLLMDSPVNEDNGMAALIDEEDDMGEFKGDGVGLGIPSLSDDEAGAWNEGNMRQLSTHQLNFSTLKFCIFATEQWDGERKSTQQWENQSRITLPEESKEEYFIPKQENITAIFHEEVLPAPVAEERLKQWVGGVDLQLSSQQSSVRAGPGLNTSTHK